MSGATISHLELKEQVAFQGSHVSRGGPVPMTLLALFMSFMITWMLTFSVLCKLLWPSVNV